MNDYVLAIGDRTYSSWSLRGWLMFAKFGIPVTVRSALMKTPEFAAMLSEFGEATTVPAMRSGDIVATDSLAIAETLAETHADLWPNDPLARAHARSLVCEMHSGYSALRTACPMNLRRCYDQFPVEPDVMADVTRMQSQWADAKSRFGGSGPWLYGAYSLADVFFAPAAMRVATYRLPVQSATARYVDAHLNDLEIRQWRAAGLAENHVRDYYDMDLPELPWPGPKAVHAETVIGIAALNESCPFSGRTVSPDSLLRIGGNVIGFCNTFCRDKVLADPEAWPKAMSLLHKA